MMIDDPTPGALYLGADAPADYLPIREIPVIIFAGLTGAGKSMAAKQMQESLDGHLLPDRRLLTDLAILPLYSDKAVTDRVERFQLTARFRQDHPGGMAQILVELSLAPDLGGKRILFDNLRGQNEIRYAAEHLPKAIFILAEAPPAVRLQRLLTRQDGFDAARDAGGELAGRLVGFAGETAAQSLMSQIRAGQFDPDQVSEKLTILEAEAENYPAEEMRACLEEHAQSRLILYATDHATPDDLMRSMRSFI